MEKAPEWCRAVGEETLLVELLERTKYSTSNPDWSVSRVTFSVWMLYLKLA